jgi:AraC-like DNA-binding protein
MRSVPVTRARHVGNFANVLESRGVPTAGYLARSHLPVDLLEVVEGESVLSALNMLDFAERAAADTGIGDLGYWAGTAPIDAYGDFGAHVVRAPTLHAAIRTFCGAVLTECSEADYYLKYSGSKAWFCHGRGGGDPLQTQHELYALMIMMQVIRLALGPEWNPARIRLQRHDEKGIADNEFLVSTNIAFGATETGIELGLPDLAMPLKWARNVDAVLDAHTSVDNMAMLPVVPVVALQELIATQLRHSTSPSIEDAAAMAGVSARTLQRQLRSKSTSFSRLVDQVRIDVAVPLLIDGAMNITEVAYQLGYANAAHFSRAFTRLTGMSPSHFRRLLSKQLVQ